MQWFTSNTALKLVSLLLAVIVWLFVKAVITESRVSGQKADGLFYQLGLVRGTHLVEREVPVRLILTGKVPTGCVVERTIVIPRTVRIKGPKPILSGLRSVETLPVDLTDRRISFRQRVDLAPPHPSIALLSHSSVEVDVRIRETNRP